MNSLRLSKPADIRYPAAPKLIDYCNNAPILWIKEILE